MQDLPLGNPDFGKAKACGCHKLNLAAGIPKRFEDATFETFDLSLNPTMQEAKETCEELARGEREAVFLLGGTGCGKTHLLVAAVRLRRERGRGAMFWICTDLLANIQAAQFDDERDIETEIEALASPTYLLALDDLGAHNRTGWSEAQMYRLLNRRYNNLAPTIISSNTPVDDLDERIRSRLRSGFVACEGDDLRERA